MPRLAAAGGGRDGTRDTGRADPLERVARPPRPSTVELAGAILIVGGLLGTLSGLGRLADPAAVAPSLGLVTVVLNVAQVVLGLLVRQGRLWLLTVNYAAVVGFLDLLAGGLSVTSLVLGLSEVIVVIALLVTKPWFDAVAQWRREAPTRPPQTP